MLHQLLLPCRCLAVAVLTLSLSPPLLAQRGDAPVHAGPRWEFGPYLGIARHSPVTRLGRTPDRSHLFVGIHFTGKMLSWGRVTVGYAPDIVPLLLVSHTPTYDATRELRGGRYVEVKRVTGESVAAGFGFSPIAAESQIRLTSRWRAYGDAALGFAWFGRDVPVPDSRAFNYTFEFGAGLQVRVHPRWQVRGGYKFHHLSNAATGVTNPGLNGNVLTMGLVRRIGSPN